MSFPSHANSSVNQVANAYSGNPQALQQRTQPQNGVTPELIDLLALQKVKAEKDAAARQMAMANNQQMPTVAEGLEQSAMQSARSEIAQKLGLPSLLNQGQNISQPQGAPGMPPQAPPQGAQGMPPQGPVVRAAAGGLMRIPSNLPQSYAGGGIIAFGDPSLNPDEDQKVPEAEKQLSMGELLDLIKARALNRGRGSDNREASRDALRNVLVGASPTEEAYRRRKETAGDVAAQQSPAATPAATPAEKAPTPPIAATNAPRPAAASTYTPPPFPVAQPGFAEMNTAVQKGLTAGLAIDPAKSRADAMKEYKDMFGAHQDAAVSAQQKGLADLVAAQEAEKAGRPDKFLGIFNRAGLAALDPTSLTPWKKVSGAVEEERQGFAKKDEANVMVRNTLTTAMHEAIAKNDASLYAAGKEAAVEALRAKGMALSDAVKYVDSQARTLEAAQANWQTNETRRQAMASAAADRAARSADASGLKEAQLEETQRRNAEAAYNRDPIIQAKVKRMGMLDMMIQGSASDPKKQAEFQAEQDKIARELATIQGQYFNPRGMDTPKEGAGADKRKVIKLGDI